MQLSIIIVSFNVKYFLEQCLHSVEAAIKNMNAEIFVVDNASPDHSIEYLQPKFPSVNFIKNDLNEGFAKANNKALKFASGKYILFLNPDTIVAENTFTNCIKFFDTNTNAGSVGVKMIDGAGNFLPESKRAFPSVSASFFKITGLAKTFSTSSIFNHYALGDLDENKIHVVDVLPGAFFISQKNILQNLNGFDEDFFMYGEDIDLSYRIQQAGYKNYYLGNNVIIHYKGESTKKTNPEYVHHFYNAMNIFVKKHYNKSASSLLKFFIFISKKIAAVKHQLISNQKEKKQLHFLLIGNAAGTTSAQNILLKYNYTVEQIDSFKQLETFESSQTKYALVFCVDDGYSETINFIQKHKNKYAYFWHHPVSQNIIGSSSSKFAGEIYTSI